jgi:hypothetical protein
VPVKFTLMTDILFTGRKFHKERTVLKHCVSVPTFIFIDNEFVPVMEIPIWITRIHLLASY